MTRAEAGLPGREKTRQSLLPEGIEAKVVGFLNASVRI